MNSESNYEPIPKEFVNAYLSVMGVEAEMKERALNIDYSKMELLGIAINLSKQVFYQEDADRLVPSGCLAIDWPQYLDGSCMDNGDCKWCSIFYYGPDSVTQEELEDI